MNKKEIEILRKAKLVNKDVFFNYVDKYFGENDTLLLEGINNFGKSVSNLLGDYNWEIFLQDLKTDYEFMNEYFKGGSNE